MSIAYRNRKKAINREKKRRGPNGLLHGQIPEMDFLRMQEDWNAKIIGRPPGAIEDFLRS